MHTTDPTPLPAGKPLWDNANKAPEPCQPCCCPRETAHNILEHKIKGLHAEIERLTTLQNLLPRKMTEDQENAVIHSLFFHI